MKFLVKLDKAVATFLKIFVIVICVAIAAILFFRVIIRFTPIVLSISWTDEVVTWMMAWMIFVTSALIMRDKQHFRVDLLDNKLKGTVAGKILDIAITILGLVFFAVFLYYSIQLVAQANAYSPMLKVSYRVPYMSMPVCCVLCLVYLFRDLVVDIAGLAGKDLVAAAKAVE